LNFLSNLMSRLNTKSNIIKIDTLIGRKTNICGDVSCTGNIKIDGKVYGDISVIGDLIIGERAEISGNISTENIIIAGVVNGNITAAGQFSIKKTASVKGEHTVGSLIVEEGSFFSGNCKILNPEKSREILEVSSEANSEANLEINLENSEKYIDKSL